MWVTSGEAKETPLLYSHGCEVVWLPCEALDLLKEKRQRGQMECLWSKKRC